MSSQANNIDEHQRKKVRKGTHSCWECRKRKVRCQYNSEEDICRGCHTRGTKCLSQKYSDADLVKPTANNNGSIDGRVDRLENVLEKLIDRIDAFNEGTDIHHKKSRPSQDFDTFTPSSKSRNDGQTATSSPILENHFFQSRLARTESDQINGLVSPNTTGTPLFNTSSKTLESRVDSLRRSLLAVMPSHRDIVTIMNATKTWWAIWFDKPTMNGPENNQSSMVDLCFSSLATRSPSFIGRALMLIVTSLQQLPLDFDYSRLSLHSTTRDLIDQYFSMVSSLVTSNDELIGNADGLECLTLQGLFFCNAGKPRRAFLSFRRALEAAQLMGLHRGVSLPDTGFVPSSAERLNDLWWTIYEADRFIPLILGLPYGIANKHCNLQTKTLEGRNVSQEEIYLRKICVIKTDIIDRNQASKVPGYAATQEIDEKLERLARTMSPSWWDMSNPIWPKDSTNLARRFHRAMVQFWHHEVESLLHLPFMLLSSTEPRYSYNKTICLKASRKMIDLYLALRENFTCGFVCKVTDFQVFIATVIILLGLIQANAKDAGGQQHADDDGDWHIIDRVISFLENPKANIDESVATQGLKVLQRLTSIGRDNDRCGGSLRLAIPYFGTISIARGSKYQDAKVIQLSGTRKNQGPADADGWSQNQIHNPHFALPLDNSDQQQNYVDNFSPPGDSFNIEFASNSAFPPFGATNLDSVLEDNVISINDLAAYQPLPEFDQDIWENWDFSVE